MTLQKKFKESYSLLSPYLYSFRKDEVNLFEMQENLKKSMEGFLYVIKNIKNKRIIASCNWMVGKILNLQDKNEDSYKRFLIAKKIYSKLFISKKISSAILADTFREISLQCLKIKKFHEAVYYANAACEFAPKDQTLVSNLSVAKLFQGNLKDAKKIAKDCQRANPNDMPSKVVLKAIKKIEKKQAIIPKTFSELETLFFGDD